MRLNKLLARRGLGARRKCDALIRSGVVRVNGAVVTEPGLQVEPERDRVQVFGRPLPRPAGLRYFAIHKPVGVISTLHDPQGRPTILGLLPPGGRYFPVGRLDADTSGLLIVTNDGDLAHHLMHPRYGVDKRYRVRVDRPPDARQLERLRTGVEFEPGITSAPARVRVLESDPGDPMIEITIHEGRFRQVRRMCEAVGLAVVRLHRAGYGPLRLGPLARGMWRELSADEVARLKAASARARPRPAGRRSTGAGPRARRPLEANGCGAVEAPAFRGRARPRSGRSAGRGPRPREGPGRARPRGAPRRSEAGASAGARTASRARDARPDRPRRPGGKPRRSARARPSRSTRRGR